MSEFLVSYEAEIRYYLLIGGFGVIAVWEGLAPRRALHSKISRRWTTNIGLTLITSVLAGWLFPLLAVGAAVAAKSAEVGLLNWIGAPHVLAFIVALVFLDLSRYLQHVLLHRVPLLWRLHRVHHSDTDYDCTTSLRFHPLEGMITLSVQLLVVVLLGAPPLAVLVYEGLFILAAFASHGNISFPSCAETLLRRIVVTPDTHRVHHSILSEESNSNFGSVFSGWDRLFHTYRAQPKAGHENMSFGLAEWRDETSVRLSSLFLLPFGGTVNRRKELSGVRGTQVESKDERRAQRSTFQ